MITFDRLLLKLPIESVKVVEPAAFSMTMSGDGAVKNSKHEQKFPFYYRVQLNYPRNVAFVEFSGKSLLDSYPDLISMDNIFTCFDNINIQNICYIMPEGAVEKAIVMQCDVTYDIKTELSIPEIYQNITLSNNRKYCIRDITTNRFTIESTSVTPRKKTRLLVYDKEEEMMRSANEPFLQSISNAQEQLDYFHNRKRIELNLNSMDRIRRYFQTEDTRLLTLLNANVDPINLFLKNVITDDISITKASRLSGNLRDMEHLLLIAICNYDLRRVELVIRDVYGSTRSITRAMEPYKKLCSRLQENIPELEKDMMLLDMRNHLRYMMAHLNLNGDNLPNTNLLQLYLQKQNEKINII